MSLMVVTINNLSPALDHKSGEVQVIAKALEDAAHAVQGAQGNLLSGGLTYNGGSIGSWTYIPQASLP